MPQPPRSKLHHPQAPPSLDDLDEDMVADLVATYNFGGGEGEAKGADGKPKTRKQVRALGWGGAWAGRVSGRCAGCAGGGASCVAGAEAVLQSSAAHSCRHRPPVNTLHRNPSCTATRVHVHVCCTHHVRLLLALALCPPHTQIMDEIIAKSKAYKALKAKQREEDEEELEALDGEWRALLAGHGLRALMKPKGYEKWVLGGGGGALILCWKRSQGFGFLWGVAGWGGVLLVVVVVVVGMEMVWVVAC